MKKQIKKEKRALSSFILERARVRRPILTAMALFVLFLTAAFVMLPAFTLERIPTCGYPDHEHEHSCYRICGMEEGQLLTDGPAQLACAFVPHVHSEWCYDGNGNIQCGYSEIYFHTHMAFCYDEEGKLICPLAEVPVHVHSENCLQNRLICIKPEHAHTDDCFQDILVCGKEGDPEHKHTLSCHKRVQVCTFEEEHVHIQDCYEPFLACGFDGTDHTHTPDCFDETGHARCGKVQYLRHEHGEACIPNAIGRHVHTDACYGTEPVCGLHVHTDACYQEAPRRDENGQFTNVYMEATGDEAESATASEALLQESGDSLSIAATLDEGSVTEDSTAVLDDAGGKQITLHNGSFTVSFGPDAGIPENTQLVVDYITKEHPDYATYAETALSLSEKAELLELADLTLVSEGKTLQPNGQVQVSYALEKEYRDLRIQAVHFPSVSSIQENEAAETDLPAAEGTASEAGQEESLQPLLRKNFMKAGSRMLTAAPVIEEESRGEPVLLEATVRNGEANFNTDGFSVFAILGTTIEKNVLASDGNQYHITVTFGADSGIPENVDLAVEEILGVSEQYGAYVSKTENLLGMEEGSADYIRLFEISIVDREDHSIKYQPKAGTAVDVRIELADSTSDELSVVHFADEKDAGSVVDSLTDGQAVEFTASGFSVYAIIDHEGGDLVTPRVVFHYIHYDFTEDAQGVRSAGAYNFRDKSVDTEDYLCTQIIKDGETLREVPTPPVFNQAYFNGWYIVDMQSDTTSFNTNTRQYTGTIRYTVPNDPIRQVFGQTIAVSMGNEDAAGLPVTWSMNGNMYTDYADDEGRIHVYLAPLYANFNYVNFYDFDGKLIARKMLVLDSNGFASMLVSDLEATSPVNTNDYFMGWSTNPYNPINDQQAEGNTLHLYEDGYKKTLYITLYRPSADEDIQVYEGVYASTDALAGLSPAFSVNTSSTGGNVNLYAEYEKAHWLRFIAGETGWGSMYVPADYLVGDTAATRLPTTTRAGYSFAGWYSGYQDSDGHIHYYEQITDENGYVLDGGLKHLVEKTAGTGDAQITTYDQYGEPEEGQSAVSYTGSVADGQLTMMKDSYLYAMWTSNDTAPYKVIIWQQKVGNTLMQTLTPVEYDNWRKANPDATTEQIAAMEAITKTYDFYNSYVETDQALTAVTLPAGSQYLNQTFTGFHLAENNDSSVYGTAAYETNVVIDPQGTSVINVYYDRNVHTYTFEVNQRSYDFTLTSSNTGTQYGFNHGKFEQLSYHDGAWYGKVYGYNYSANANGDYIQLSDGSYAALKPVYDTNTTYTADYSYARTTTNNNNVTQYGINSNGEYSELTKTDYLYTPYSGTPTSGTYYGYRNGAFERLTRWNGRWYYGITEYSGIFYSRTSQSNTYYIGPEQYTGNRYTRANDNANDVTQSQTLNTEELYYVDGNGGKVPVTRHVDQILRGYTYVDETGTTRNYENQQRYSRAYGEIGSDIYTGARYTRSSTQSNGYHPTYIITDLYGNNIADHFPFTDGAISYGSDGTNYSEARWTATDSVIWEDPMVYIDTMTDEDVTFQYSDPGNRPRKTMNYYVEVLDGETPDITFNGVGYRLYKTVGARYNFITTEDLTPITGYTYQISDSTEFNQNGKTTSSSRDETFSFFYSRNKYSVTFATNYPGEAQFTSGASASENSIMTGVPYEASLQPYGNAAPSFTAPDHYIFDGWYEDQSCTVPFDFSQTMPAANKVVYAKWYPVYYLIQIDPNGGMLAGTYNQNESTYFWLQYGMTIGQYPTSRNMIETTAEEAAELGVDTYYYRHVTPTINANGTIEEHAAWTAANTATLWASDLDSEKDNEGIRPAFYRMAEYVMVSDYHTNGDAFYQYMISNGSQALADSWDGRYVNTGKLYREVTATDPIWSFVGWYRDGHPYDFTQAVTSDVTLNAVWRQAGEYYLYYDPRMQIEGAVGTLTGPAYDPGDPRNTSEGYIDKATTHVATAPTNIHGVNSADTYIFEGWRVVGPNGNPLDEYGNILTEERFNENPERYLYQPGDEIMIRSEQSYTEENHNIIQLRAYYRRVEDSNRYPDVVQLVLDANTDYSGYLDADAAAWPTWTEPGSSIVDTQTTATVSGETHPYQIVFGDAQENQGIHLLNYRPFFVNAEGYFLLGFDPQPNPEQCEHGAYIPKYAADAVIGIDEPNMPNKLYAIWEPMVYVTFVNYTGAPVTVSLNSLSGSASIQATVVNNATQTYERSAVTAMNSVIVASGQTLRLVLPEGSGKDLELSIANNHIGFEMSATKQVGDNPAQQLFGGNLENPLDYGEAFTDLQRLITSFTGIVYTLTEEPLDYAYFDVNGGNWTDTKPFWRVMESGIYQNDYQIAIENFMQPSDPTAPANTLFLGWTTDPYVAKIRDFSLTIDQLTARRDAAQPGTDQYLLYDHLINLIAEYKAAYGITEVTNLLQVVEAYSLWNFSNPPAGTVYYAVYAELAEVRYHLMNEYGRNYTYDHKWELPTSGNNNQSIGQMGTVYTRSTVRESDGNSHYVWSRYVVKGRSIIKPLAPTYYQNGSPTFLYWLENNYSYTHNPVTPSNVHPFSFVEPITRDVDLYTSWTDRYRTTLNVGKTVKGSQASVTDAFSFRYYINTYKYTYTGGKTSRMQYQSDSTGISLAGGEDRDINLFYWTDEEGALYAQAVQVSETGLLSSGYELTIEDIEGHNSNNVPTALTPLAFVDNGTGENYYRFYPVSNHAVEENSSNYYMNGVSEKEQKTVWHFTKGNYDLYFWNNGWYKDVLCTESAQSNQIPNDQHKVNFTNEKDARIRFIKVDENGFDRLNDAEFILTRKDSDEGIRLISGYVKTRNETTGRNGRFILAPGETIPAELPVRMDTDKNELVFMETGTYRLTETKAPPGYFLPSEWETGRADYVDIKVEPTGITLTGNADIASGVALSQLNIGEFDSSNEHAVVIKNKPKQAAFVIQKVDTAGNTLINGAASFTVTGTASASGTYVNLGTISTDEENEAKTEVQIVPYGTYHVTETSAPNGYKLAEETEIVIGDEATANGNNVYGGTITGTGTTDDPYVITIQDEETGYNLSLKKVVVNGPNTSPEPEYTVTVKANDSDTERLLAGKTYNMIMTSPGNVSTNSSIRFDETSQASVTIKDGWTVTLRSLPGGRYTVKETVNGFGVHIEVKEPSTNHILVNDSKNTATFTLSTATVATITNTYGVPVKIVKIDQEGRPLEGVSFKLTGGGLNENLESTKRTVTVNGQSVSEALIYETDILPLGQYILTETATPAGYIPLAGPVEINVNNKEEGLVVTAKVGGVKIEYPWVAMDNTTKVWTIMVMNQIGYELPSTGGPGTRLMYFLGSMLILLAGVALLIKRRRGN